MDICKLSIKFVGNIKQTDMENNPEVGVVLNTHVISVDSKEKFYLMYSSMVVILKQSSDVKMKLFAALLERYSKGQEFSLNGGIREVIARETGCKPRSLEAALTFLIRHHILIEVTKRVYRINPRHVFEGTNFDRNESLKAIIELHCPEC